MYINPVGYEVRDVKIEEYVKIILKSNRDEEFDRFGTYDKLMQLTYQENLENFPRRIKRKP